MTRKDYVALAAALRLANQITDNQGWDDRTYVSAIANVLAADNPRFDRARFYAAAGVQS